MDICTSLFRSVPDSIFMGNWRAETGFLNDLDGTYRCYTNTIHHHGLYFRLSSLYKSGVASSRFSSSGKHLNVWKASILVLYVQVFGIDGLRNIYKITFRGLKTMPVFFLCVAVLVIFEPWESAFLIILLGMPNRSCFSWSCFLNTFTRRGILAGTWINSILLTLEYLQAYKYFKTYPNDPKLLRITQVCLRPHIRTWYSCVNA